MTDLLTAFPGARTTVDHDHSITLTPLAPRLPAQKVAIARRRATVRSQITSCARCPLSSASWVHSPVPFSGPTPARWALVGEAPGRKENRGGEMFADKPGRLLRGMVADAGLAWDEAMVANTVSCWPDGTPTEANVRACRPNLTAQLDLAHTPFVLLVGGVALSAFRPGLRVMVTNGWAFCQAGRVLVPVLHPGFVARNPKARGDAMWAIERFAALVKGELAPSHLFGDRCATGCGGWVGEYDPEGMPWCSVHAGTREKTPTEAGGVRAVEVAKKVAAARKKAAARRQTEAF